MNSPLDMPFWSKIFLCAILLHRFTASCFYLYIFYMFFYVSHTHTRIDIQLYLCSRIVAGHIFAHEVNAWQSFVKTMSFSCCYGNTLPTCNFQIIAYNMTALLREKSFTERNSMLTIGWVVWVMCWTNSICPHTNTPTDARLIVHCQYDTQHRTECNGNTVSLSHCACVCFACPFIRMTLFP